MNIKFSLLLYVHYIFTINYVNGWKINKVNIISKLSMIRNNNINTFNNFNSFISKHKNNIMPVILSSCLISCQLSFPMNTKAQSNDNNINVINYDNNQKVYFGVGCFWVSIYQNTIQSIIIIIITTTTTTTIIIIINITIIIIIIMIISVIIFIIDID